MSASSSSSDDPFGTPPTPTTGDAMDSTQSEPTTDARPGVSASAGLPAAALPKPGQAAKPSMSREAIFTLQDVSVRYGGVPAVENVTFDLLKNDITAFIGPSGCGKSTLLRCLNRMNDLIPSASVHGSVRYHDQDLYAPDIDPVQVRKRIGMVFQKPNPFPKSIYENIAFGPRVLGMKGDMDEIVETALRKGALWDEVKDRLKTNAFGMSGGQQQRLCIARTMAVEPDVILMDEPCSALDPISTGAIEELMLELKQNYSIVIVTHNMQQAARVSDMTAFYNVDKLEEGKRVGKLVEFARDREDLHRPRRPAHRAVRHREVRLIAVALDHQRSHFQQQLAELEASALGGLDLVCGQLDRVIEALQHQDVELAQFVIADDDRLDGRYLEVHQGILSLLALQAPVAGDLRLVAALLHLIKHVERMGDQCVNVAKLIPLTGHEPPVRDEILCKVVQMGEAARAEVVQCKRAFAERNVAMAEDLVERDRDVNRLNREVFRLAVEVGDDADTREWAMTMILMARAFERVGDNAVDIGEQTAFVVTGLFREFTDATHAAPYEPTPGTTRGSAHSAPFEPARHAMTCPAWVSTSHARGRYRAVASRRTTASGPGRTDRTRPDRSRR